MGGAKDIQANKTDSYPQPHGADSPLGMGGGKTSQILVRAMKESNEERDGKWLWGRECRQPPQIGGPKLRSGLDREKETVTDSSG